VFGARCRVQGEGYGVLFWGGLRPIPIKADDLAASDLREGMPEREIEGRQRERERSEGRKDG